MNEDDIKWHKMSDESPDEPEEHWDPEWWFENGIPEVELDE